MKQLILILLIILNSPVVLATKLVLDPVTIPELTSDLKNQIKNMSTEELKEAGKHYRTLISTMISYLDLTTGRKPSKPYMTVEFSNQDRIDNLYRMIRKGNEIKDQVNEAVVAAQQQQSPIRVMFSEITLSDGEKNCTTNPIVKTINLGEIHKFTVECDSDIKRNLELKTSFIVGYAANYTLRTQDQQVIAVDIFTDNSISTLVQPINSQDLTLTLKTTYKPL